LPIDPHHQEEIAAAVGAYNAAGRRPPLEAADATRLLTVMFADADICQRNRDSLVAEGFSRGTFAQVLRILIEAGLVTKERGRGSAPNTYRLHLPLRATP
jgi:hypothetical protein